MANVATARVDLPIQAHTVVGRGACQAIGSADRAGSAEFNQDSS